MKILTPANLALGALVLLAFVLRAAYPGLMEFKHDEAVAWIRVHALLTGVEFPCAGLMSSKGIANFPLFLYILAFFQVIFRSPHMLVLPIALMNSIAVLFVFHGVRRLFSERTAWLTALFYAVSPCAVFFSRKIWAQDLMPFWATGAFFCGAYLIAGNLSQARKRYLAISLAFLLATSFQIHLSGILLLGAYIALLLLYRKHFGPFKPLLIGFGAGLLPAIPYLVHLLRGEAGGLGQMAGGLAAGLRYRPKDLVNFFVRQPTDEGVHAYLGSDYASFLDSIPGYNILRYLTSALVLAGIAICFYQLLRGGATRRRACGFLFALTTLPLAAYGLSRISLVPSYFLILYPLPFLFVALLVSEAWRLAETRIGARTARLCAVFCVTSAVVCNLAYLARFTHKVRQDGGARGTYGITYNETREAARWLIEQTGTDGHLLRPEALEQIDLALWASLIAEGATFSSQSANPSEDQYLLVNRLRHPEQNKRSQARIIHQSTAYSLLKAPAEVISVIATKYSSSRLTPHQTAEEKRVKILAKELLSKR